MSVRVLLMATVLSLVYVTSIETREVQPLSPPSEIYPSRPNADMDTESTKAVEQKLTHEHNPQEERITTSKNANSSPPLIETISVKSNGSMQPGMKHPKKRATYNKDDRKADLRPGCCK
ncbi:uncharacterized protein LOC128885787 [Hylaeus anthracinus]|uniref:uncharacterized protein LOC128885787 n=1 Tax=Hylaeus anthracinus TaxID=313031 RepID=UPI0023B9F436|nr:uncharacterized protein LOC128885787 [Hylaeus anthracinus]